MSRPKASAPRRRWIMPSLAVAAIAVTATVVAIALRARPTQPSPPVTAAQPTVSPVDRSATAIPVPPVLFAVISGIRPENGDATNAHVDLVDPVGALVAHVALPHGTSRQFGFPTAPVGLTVGNTLGAYVSNGDAVFRISRDGTATRLGAVPSDVASMVISPDGSRWAYSVVTWSNDATITATTDVFVGDAGTVGNRVVTLHRPNIEGTYEGGYRPLAWTTKGILLGSDPTQVGGEGPFIDSGYAQAVVVLMDPTAGAISQPLAPTGCLFQDIADDGTVACLPGRGQNGTSITLISPQGATSRLPMPRSDWIGDVRFLQGSRDVVFETATLLNASQGVGWRTDVGVIIGGTTRMVTHDVGVQAHVTVIDPSTVLIINSGTDAAGANLIHLDTGTTGHLGGQFAMAVVR